MLTFATQKCDHKFCTDCLQQHIQIKVGQKVLDVPCPDTHCNRKLDPDTLCEVGREVDVARLEAQRKEMILHQHENYRVCTAQNCWGGQVGFFFLLLPPPCLCLVPGDVDWPCFIAIVSLDPRPKIGDDCQVPSVWPSQLLLSQGSLSQGPDLRRVPRHQLGVAQANFQALS